jgi:hypothetical protein
MGMIKGIIKFGCMGLMLCVFSCVKTSNPDPVIPPPDPSSDGPVKSMTTYLTAGRSKTVQFFSYDQYDLLMGIRTYTYDSLFDPYIDSMSVILGSWQTGRPPAYYDVLYQYHWAPAGGLSEHHLMFYDNQNRIVRDSIASGTNNNNSYTVAYNYDTSAFTVVGKNRVYIEGSPGTIQVNEADSFLIESENITYDLRSDPYNTFLQESDAMYSTNPNPLYNETFAKSVAIALTFHGYGNFRNKNLPSHALILDRNFNALTFNYRWTIDAKGRVISGFGEAGSQHDNYIFTY